MTWLKRFWRWMQEPQCPETGISYERAVELQKDAYETGLAQGELRGRLALAKELEAIYADGGTAALDLEQARAIKARQVH